MTLCRVDEVDMFDPYSSLAFRKDARYSRTGQNVVFGLAVSQS